MFSEKRFWENVQNLDDSKDTCWIWTGSFTDDGYGRCFRDYGELRAHRVAWELEHGKEIPDGYRLTQTCASPGCVRHWELGGKREKLTPAARREIAASDGSAADVAQRYGITRQYVFMLRRASELTALRTGLPGR